MSKKPVAVGFGISTPDQAQNVAQFADGVIIGSAIVRMIAEQDQGLSFLANLKTMTQNLKTSLSSNT